MSDAAELLRLSVLVDGLSPRESTTQQNLDRHDHPFIESCDQPMVRGQDRGVDRAE